MSVSVFRGNYLLVEKYILYIRKVVNEKCVNEIDTFLNRQKKWVISVTLWIWAERNRFDVSSLVVSIKLDNVMCGDEYVVIVDLG